MAKVIRPEDLAAVIAEELDQYKGDVVEGMNKEAQAVARKIKQLLRKDPTPELTGEYKESWSTKTQKAPGGHKNQIVYAKAPHYRKTHLLEHGHASPDGGRVPAYPHIAPAEEEAAKEYQDRIEKVVKG